MNRQDRRKQKNNFALNKVSHNQLIEAIKLHSEKNFVAAEKIYRKLINNNPKNYDVIRHLGILYQDLGNLETAFNFFTKSLKINPNGFESLNNLGVIHLSNNNYLLALKCFNQSLKIKPDYVPTINNLAGYYHKKQMKKEALLYAKRGLQFQPSNPMALNQFAKALIINSELEEAISVLQNLVSDYPSNDDFKINLASAYKEMGEFKKSKEITDKGFIKNYKIISYFVSYVTDKKNKLLDEHIAFYENYIKDTKNDIDSKIVVSYSLFNYFRNQDLVNKAGEYLTKANELQFSRQKFNIENEKKFFLKIKELFESKKNISLNASDAKLKPIFICGMPRSGTTLCEQIISSHSKVVGAGELNYLCNLIGLEKYVCASEQNIKRFEETLNNHDMLIAAREGYLEQLAAHVEKNDTVYVCDKMPHNFVLIGLIKILFPESKIIYCKRDPMDNCFSLYTHKFLEMSHQYSYDQETLGEYYMLHIDLMDYWLGTEDNNIFVLDNEELVQNQESISKKLIEFCDLEWENECLEFHKNKRQVRTASIEQVRQPMNTKSIGAWKKYESFLVELNSVLK